MLATVAGSKPDWKRRLYDGAYKAANEEEEQETVLDAMHLQGLLCADRQCTLRRFWGSLLFLVS
jgi:hypothetical protein